MTATTQWSQVLAARGDDSAARRALDGLCRRYRPPVVAFLRARGLAPDAAEDQAQAFFAHFLVSRLHATADRDRGRFRTLLYAALRNFLANAVEHDDTVKRGGRVRFEPLALREAELGAAETDAPDASFDRAWVLALLEHAFTRLRRDAVRAGKGARFDRLSEYLLEPPAADSYAAAAAELQLAQNTVAVTVHRLRAKLREALVAELRDTVGSEDALRAELEALRGPLGLAR